MPMIDVTYPEGFLAPDARQQLADELTTALLRAERAPDTQFFRDITWAFLHELPEGCVGSAGERAASSASRETAAISAGSSASLTPRTSFSCSPSGAKKSS